MSMNGVIWVTTHQGKMKGINSISTSSANNPNCLTRRQNGDSICAHCYAQTYLKMRRTLKQHLEENEKVLTTRHLEGREIPVTNDLVFRFESFGDLFNETHLENYLLICKANKYTKFGLWSKNLWILDNVFNKKGVEKPKNLSIVASSPLLNKQMDIDREKYWFIDHVFTVYDKKFVEENGICINCGANNCLKCQLCYHSDTDFYINELLK